MRYDPHRLPLHIFTTHLAVSGIVFSSEDSIARVYAVYGDMLDGDLPTIEFETDFNGLYDLISLIDGQTDDVLEKLSTIIANPSDEPVSIDIPGGLYFEHHIFSFILIEEEGDEENPAPPEDTTYLLGGYAERKPYFPLFSDLDKIPEDKEERLHYYSRGLAMQYHLYVSFIKKMRKLQALTCSGLTAPHIFALAKAQYELLKPIEEAEDY